MYIYLGPKYLLRRYDAYQFLQFLLVSDIGDGFKSCQVQVVAIRVLTFLETGLEDGQEVSDDLLLHGVDGGGLRRLEGNEYLFNCRPEPAEFLIADIPIRIDINNAVDTLHLILPKGIGLIGRTAIDPKSTKSKMIISCSQNIKNSMFTPTTISLIHLLQ